MSADPAGIEIVETTAGVELTVKVVPGASRTKITGVWGTALRVAVAAPPEGGKANAAVTKLLASTFGVKRGEVEIVGGCARPLKRLAISGLTIERARTLLARTLP